MNNCESGPYLVDLFVGEMLTTGDVLPSHGRVHVGFDGAGCDGVDRDFLVAAVDCLG
jgi:hypothetical protein